MEKKLNKKYIKTTRSDRVGRSVLLSAHFCCCGERKTLNGGMDGLW